MCVFQEPEPKNCCFQLEIRVSPKLLKFLSSPRSILKHQSKTCSLNRLFGKHLRAMLTKHRAWALVIGIRLLSSGIFQVLAIFLRILICLKVVPLLILSARFLLIGFLLTTWRFGNCQPFNLNNTNAFLLSLWYDFACYVGCYNEASSALISFRISQVYFNFLVTRCLACI